MKKAVIKAGGKQYLVEEGLTLDIDHIPEVKKKLEFTPLLIIDGEKSTIGTPEVTASKVTAEVVDPLVKGEKTTAIRYKAKKRVNKVRGHRQQYTKIKIASIK